MLVAGLENGKHFAKSLCTAKGFSRLEIEHKFFPDGEHYIRFRGNVKGKKVVLVQSMYPNPNDSLVELFLCAKTAKQLGAKKVVGLIPYLGYMRQDKVFHAGESFSAKHIAGLLSSCLDEAVTFDAHLHRIKKMSQVFSVKAANLTADKNIGVFVEKKFSKKNTVIVGPDFESSQWASVIAKKIGFESTVLEKKRLSSRKVIVKMPKEFHFLGKHVVIIDDIASTGHTIEAATKEILKQKPLSVNCVFVHALLVEGALEKLRKAGVKKIFSCNTVWHKTNAIDLGAEAAKYLK